MNILISQEKMGDNIKKVANLFVVSDFVDEIDFVSSSMKF